MLLNSMTRNLKALVVTPPTAFLSITNQKSLSRTKEEIEALLSLNECVCDFSSRFSPALQNGDFVILNSDDSGKLPIFSLGVSKSSTLEEAPGFQMKLLTSDVNGLDKEFIENIKKERIAIPNYTHTLKYLRKTNFCFLKRC